MGTLASSISAIQGTSAKRRRTLWERGEHLLLPLRRYNQQEQWPNTILQRPFVKYRFLSYPILRASYANFSACACAMARVRLFTPSLR